MMSFEIWRGKKPNPKYLHEFRSTCFVLNDKEYMSKFDPKSDESVFLEYFPSNRAYKVFNKRSKTVMESTNIVINDQGIVSTGPKSNESETDGPLQ